ncbi:pyridoxal phosphate-dependent aminotransferase [Candidatus Methanoliparum sp. LAM-1]|uniref:pyridoxal phosphate-dependent aminotransferase n=1 Tax=Candidatus Methanoliparum sp. LAM-1 TaxID=2874846 RepID=UPI001E32744B|nr:pyridoxal phosphate-dependent aminotransferase [Candidatus Methanoliparum sp. LAM-1]BDC36225.1 pyridoxal phosphate-dependent aminotransferase [Candidatus Methanoliparum sp. LAM-1]
MRKNILSNRVNFIKDSATLRLNDIGEQLRSKGADIINLSVGEPDFDTPKFIKDAAKKALDNGDTHYTPSLGKPRLRKVVAEKLKKDNNIDTSYENIIISAGAKHLIYMAINSIIDEGEEVVLLSPAWVSYEACVKIAGGRINWIKTNIEDQFQPTDIQDNINKKTKLIVLNSPNNPSGAVYSENTLKMIADLSIDYDFFVLSDEIYEKIIYDSKHISIASFDQMADRTITVNGLSKSYAMTGWRIGYASAPKIILDGMLKIQQHSISCAPSFVQEAAISAMSGPQDCVNEMVSEFKKRRDFLVDGLNSIGLRCLLPKGAFYLFVDISDFAEDANEFSEKMLKEGYLVMTPGDAFGPGFENYIRISYAVPIDKLKEAVKRIGNIIA